MDCGYKLYEESIEKVIPFYQNTFMEKYNRVVLLPKKQMEAIIYTLVYYNDEGLWEDYDKDKMDEFLKYNLELLFQCLEVVFQHVVGQCDEEIYHYTFANNDFDEKFILGNLLMYVDLIIEEMDYRKFKLIGEVFIKYQDLLVGYDHNNWIMKYSTNDQKIKEAITLLKQLKYEDADHYSFIGTLYILIEDEANSLAAFDKALQVADEDTIGPIKHLIAIQLKNAKKYKIALEFIESAIERHPKDGDYDTLALMYHNKSQIDRSIHMYYGPRRMGGSKHYN